MAGQHLIPRGKLLTFKEKSTKILFIIYVFKEWFVCSKLRNGISFGALGPKMIESDSINFLNAEMNAKKEWECIFTFCANGFKQLLNI